MGKIDYKSSGVDIDEGNRFVKIIKNIVESTYNKNVLGSIGGFAGFFDISMAKDMKEPVLVSSTDGVGTKLKIAIDTGIVDTVGIDLVAMCVNDLIVTGAKPLYFLDYMATGALNPEKMADIVKGIADGCRQSGSALIGGETAEMPGMYADGDFDLAGFSVGILDKAKVIDGSTIKPGDAIIGLASSGMHSNGYSLARKIFFQELKKKPEDIIYDGKTVAEVLLTPTQIYVKPILKLIEDVNVKGMANITGGGFYDNIPRCMPENTVAVIDKNSYEQIPLFKFINELGIVEERELYRVFNMGIGYIAVTAKEDAQKAVESLADSGINAYVIGEVAEGTEEVIIKGIDE